jgi:hypothetical protein
VLYECHLDDSKDGRQEIAYVCAGFYGSRYAWEKFEIVWQAQLAKEGIEYFKTSECVRLTKQFAKFKKFPAPHGKDAALQVRERLRQLILNAKGIHKIGVAVPVREYKAVMAYPSAHLVFGERGIYHRAFELTLLRAVRLTCTSSKDAIAFFHDDGDDYSELLALYKSFKKHNRETAPYMKGFMPLNDKERGSIQAADLIANLVLGTSIGTIENKSTQAERSLVEFGPKGLTWWDREPLEKTLLHNMRKKGIEPPKSLVDAVATHPPRDGFLPV